MFQIIFLVSLFLFFPSFPTTELKQCGLSLKHFNLNTLTELYQNGEKKLKGKKINMIPGQYFIGDRVGRMAYLHQYNSVTVEGKKIIILI